MNDEINPKHYKSDPSGVECIEITEHRDFCIGNAIKYLWRAGLKVSTVPVADEITDLKKAIWYIERKIKALEAGAETTQVSDNITRRRPVIIESPYSGDVARNRRYLQSAIRDCLRRGETPYASHQMLTDALDDNIPEQRELGISAGFAMRDLLVSQGATVAFYIDHGMSSGMLRSNKTLPRTAAIAFRILGER